MLGGPRCNGAGRDGSGLAGARRVEDDERWIDIDVAQQMLAVREGAQLLYVTLISGGKRDRPTPLGQFRIRDKRAYVSMAARKNSPDR